MLDLKTDLCASAAASCVAGFRVQLPAVPRVPRVGKMASPPLPRARTGSCSAPGATAGRTRLLQSKASLVGCVVGREQGVTRSSRA